MKHTIHLYINPAGEHSVFTSITAALNSLDATANIQDGSSSSTAASDKVYPAPESALPRTVLHIAPGVYREKLVVSHPNVTFLGEGDTPEDVVIVYGDGAFDIMPEGDKRGTFRTASVRIDAQDFHASNLTFQNDAGPGYKAGQALALYVDGDRAIFENCRMIASQDTIFTAPLPEQEAQAGGFKGPGEFKPRIMTRQYYKNCYIEGDVDFIFGSAVCLFEDCTIFSRARGDVLDKAAELAKAGESAATLTHGYVTAASSPQSATYGYVFRNCRLESDCPKSSVYLGRPWREYAKTVFLNCYLGEHIRPEGWQDWNKTHGHFYYGEYASFGPGANPDAREYYAHNLTEDEAVTYATELIFAGWLPM